MSVLDGPGEGTWSVFAQKVVEERDEARHALQEILAVIHRDGGHYTGKHGVAKSVEDAHAAWAAMMREHDELLQRVETLRELADRAAYEQGVAQRRMTEAQTARDNATFRARRACQLLIEEVGADGPTDVDEVADRAAVLIRELRDQVNDLQAAAEESEHQMHLRVRAGYDKTIADAWRRKVEEVEDQRNANAREIDKLRAERRQLRARLVECRPWVGVVPYPNTPGFSEMIAIRDLADDTLEEVK